MSTRRQKKFSREAHLQPAKKWIATYSGRDLVRGYRKWFAFVARAPILRLDEDQKSVSTLVKKLRAKGICVQD